MKGLRQEDLVNQDLITELRKEFSMTHDDFYMVLTDTDMRVKVRTQQITNKTCPIRSLLLCMPEATDASFTMLNVCWSDVYQVWKWHVTMSYSQGICTQVAINLWKIYHLN